MTQPTKQQERPSSNSAARFGTFAGVFVPNVLTILGIILFLRSGWVVGQAGLWGALGIVTLANMISLLTGLSLSAVATNMRVRAGGNYYLISRSLGLEIGGAIGIPLYLSQAISVAFYIIGFTEALLAVEFFQQIDPRLIATSVTLLFVGIAYTGADFALRIQYVILAILLAALVSFFVGSFTNYVPPNLQANYTEGVNFWVVFAVFFPAVTGIEVGTSLSGDLKDPSKSIPIGTIGSILFTFVIYVLVVLAFAFTSTADQLIGDNLAMQRVAIIPELILAGVWASTLSSALGSVLAAPRTLQAIARDAVVPRWIGSTMGSKTEPRMAVLITGVVALTVIWLGDLDVVAPIISMFFLNTYGMVNLASTIEKVVGNPSYRPRFKIPWWVSFLGAIGCYGAMFLIDPLATIFAIFVSYGFYVYLQRRQIEHTWGDVRSGVWFALARFALLRMEDENWQHWSVKNWRPNIMVFTGQPHNRQQLVEVSQWLNQGHGIVTFFQLIVGDIQEIAGSGMRQRAAKSIRTYIEKYHMSAFVEVDVAPTFTEGALTIAQAAGVGGLKANTVLLGWSRNPDGRANQIRLMRHLIALQKNVLFLKWDPERGFGKRKRINVWWQGRGGNEDLMLLLVHLIEQHPSWRNVKVYLKRIVDSDEAVEATQAHMRGILKTVRVKAEPVCIVREDRSQPIADVITEYSQDSDLTILGMHLPEMVESETYSVRLHSLVEGVGSVLLVRNADTQEGLLEGDDT